MKARQVATENCFCDFFNSSLLKRLPKVFPSAGSPHSVDYTLLTQLTPHSVDYTLLTQLTLVHSAYQRLRMPSRDTAQGLFCVLLTAVSSFPKLLHDSRAIINAGLSQYLVIARITLTGIYHTIWHCLFFFFEHRVPCSPGYPAIQFIAEDGL